MQMQQILIAFGAAVLGHQIPLSKAGKHGKMCFFHRRSWQRGKAGASLVGRRAKPALWNTQKNDHEETRRCWPELSVHRQKQIRHKEGCNLGDLWLKSYFGVQWPSSGSVLAEMNFLSALMPHFWWNEVRIVEALWKLSCLQQRQGPHFISNCWQSN